MVSAPIQDTYLDNIIIIIIFIIIFYILLKNMDGVLLYSLKL